MSAVYEFCNRAHNQACSSMLAIGNGLPFRNRIRRLVYYTFGICSRRGLFIVDTIMIIPRID